MIKVLNSNYKPIAILDKVNECTVYEEINGMYVLHFSVVRDEKANDFLNENSLLEIDGQFFDVIKFDKKQIENGIVLFELECEHISYRLYEDVVDYFTEIGTPTEILQTLLTGTDLELGTVDMPNTQIGISILEESTKKGMLHLIANEWGRELEYLGKTINIVQQRGTQNNGLIFTKGKNIKVITETVNKAIKDDLNEPLYSLKCTPAGLTTNDISLGDKVRLIQPEMNLDKELRIVNLTYNPYNKMETEFEIANRDITVSDQIYQFEANKLIKDRVYNGVRIGPEEGIVVERNDGTAKAVMNATSGFELWGATGPNDTLQKNFYVDVDGIVQSRGYNTIGSGNNIFKADANGIYLGNQDFNDAPFSVNMQGKLKARDVLVKEGYVLGASLMGGDFVQHPTSSESSIIGQGFILPEALGPGTPTMLFINGLTYEQVPINSFIDIGTYAFGSDLAKNAKITSHQTEVSGGDVVITVDKPFYSFYSGVFFVPTTGAVEHKPFTLYAVPVVNYENIGSYASQILGGIDYTQNTITLYARQRNITGNQYPTQLRLQSDNNIDMYAGGFIVMAGVKFIFLQGGKVYGIDPYDNISVGQPALIRTA